MRYSTIVAAAAVLLVSQVAASPSPKGGAGAPKAPEPASAPKGKPKGKDEGENGLPDAGGGDGTTIPNKPAGGISLLESSIASSCGLDVCDEPDCYFEVNNVLGCTGASDPYPGSCSFPLARPMTVGICGGAKVTLDSKAKTLSLTTKDGKTAKCTWTGTMGSGTGCQPS